MPTQKINKYKVLKTALLFTGFCLLPWMSGCGIQSNTSRSSSSEPTAESILVELAPTDRPFPEVFFKGREAVCRRGRPDEVPGLENEQEKTTQATGDGASADGEEPAAGTTPNANPPTVTFTTTTVADNWFSFGLHFANNSNLYLVIERLVFNISGHWGQDVLTGQSEIGSGYCETDPLYTIPPKVKRRYEPHRKNYVNNLILYVSGVPVPTGPPVSDSVNNAGAGAGAGAGALASQQGTGRGANPQSQQAGGGTQTGDTQANNQPPPLNQNDEYVINRLPSYRVQLLLEGSFITNQGVTRANFRKALVFYTTSQFIQ